MTVTLEKDVLAIYAEKLSNLLDKMAAHTLRKTLYCVHQRTKYIIQHYSSSLFLYIGRSVIRYHDMLYQQYKWG